MGEDLGPRERVVELRHRAVSAGAVETFLRVVWKVAFVLVATIVVLFAVGWVVQTLGPGSRSEDATVPTEENR